MAERIKASENLIFVNIYAFIEFQDTSLTRTSRSRNRKKFMFQANINNQFLMNDGDDVGEN